MHHRQHVYRKGFALPTVLIASIVLLSVLAVGVSATSAIRTTLKNQYYAQLAQVAGEAGVAYAKACLAANGNVAQWDTAHPLKPSTDCSGTPIVGATVKSLIVAGGGSGGGGTGGGGGAGGVIYNDSNSVTVASYPIVIGAGGAAVGFGNNPGNDGANSTFNGQTAIGGGGGGHSASGIPGTNGRNGGSGGGGQGYYSIHAGGTGTVGQGYDGGTPTTTNTGGGGGAGGAGTASVTAGTGGAGGSGVTNSITGGLQLYAAGGGGGAATTAGIGGSGIGGTGGLSSGAGTAGQVNTGSGGGGGYSHSAGGGGAGGSGVIIISYPTSSGIVATGGTITIAGLNTVHKFTSNGTFAITSVSNGCPSDLKCSVTVNGNIRSSFSVPSPNVDTNGKAISIPYNGYVEITRTSNGAIWRTINQPSLQAAVVNDLCSGQTTSAQGWNNAVRATTQDSMSGYPASQSITVANTTLNAGGMYFRRDFSVIQPGTYNIASLTPTSQDIADVYIDGAKVTTISGAQTSASSDLTNGCHSLVVKLTNATVTPRVSRFMLALQKSDASSPLIVTDANWRVATGNSVHYSSPKYYADPASWVGIRDLGSPGTLQDNAGSLRSITTPVTATAGYAYFRDLRTVTVASPTEVRTGYACSVSCTVYVDGDIIGIGNPSIVTYVQTTLQPGDHTFGVRMQGTSGSPIFYLSSSRVSDGVVMTQSDTNWITSNVWTTAQDFYSYDTSFIPAPNPFPTGLLAVFTVGGGGGGGTGMGGGGGGGGVLYNPSYTAIGSLNITVGAGGTGAYPSPGTVRGSNGGSTVVSGVIGPAITAFGGGGGGSNYAANTAPPSSGSSAGGNAAYLQTTPSVGIPGQGYGETVLATAYYPSGGGGAGGVGAVAPGNGGVGLMNDILGPAYYWGGGGGGSGYNSGATGNGGNGGNGGGGGGAIGTTTGGAGINAGSAGGGGAPATQANKPGGNGGTNTGGGGGGGSHYNTPYANQGGTGGSGIVVISYPNDGTISATGGTVTIVASRKVHTFTSSGTFTIGNNKPSVNVLTVGGGGGGGYAGASGGGGGGGVVATSKTITAIGAYSVSVGAGGAGGTTPTNGGNSSIFGLTGYGGGAGSSGNGVNGGSGGGSGRTATTSTFFALGVSGQGNNGGTAGLYGGQYPASGGGGAGGPGQSVGSSPGTSGYGGDGIASAISGTTVLYGAGGGGGGDYCCSRNLGPGAGGAGGGGAGGNSGGYGSNGTTNTGAGGGGATQTSAGTTGTGGAGGSGIVIIAYPTGLLTATGGTITTSGGFTIHTFTSSGTFTVTAI